MARRCFVTDLPRPGRCTLDPHLAHHLRDVLRLRRGDSVVLFDGSGFEVPARIAEVHRQRVVVEASEPIAVDEPPLRRVELAFSPPRAGRVAQILEHATELGAAALRPLRCARTPPSGVMRRERWTRIVQAAAAQSGRTFLPRCDDQLELSEFVRLARGESHLQRFVALPGAEVPGRLATHSVLVAVGPEGGWTDAERELLLDAGFEPFGLGPFTLRVETAALAALTLGLYLPGA